MSDKKTKDLAKTEFAKLKSEDLAVIPLNEPGESIVELTKAEVLAIMEAFRQRKAPNEIRRTVKRGELQCFTQEQILGVFEAWQETIAEKAPVPPEVPVLPEEGLAT